VEAGLGQERGKSKSVWGAAVILFRGLSGSVGEDKILNRGEGGGSREKDGFRVRYFLYFFFDVVKIAPTLKTSVAWYL